MLLEVQDLHVEVKGREVLRGVNLTVDRGESVMLMGPNGSGKSSLIHAIMGHPDYRVTKGSIIFEGKILDGLRTDERAKLGIGVSFQLPPKVSGVTLGKLLSEIHEETGKHDGDPIEKYVELLNCSELVGRDVNVGFSGGETKRGELLLLLAQRPMFSMIDEPDSGVDVESIRLVTKAIEEVLRPRDSDPQDRPSALIVTHQGTIGKLVNASRAYIMIDGRIACFGEAKAIVDLVLTRGFEECVRCTKRGR
jgi:Fe-S cluster assembly ATP-binding protein